MFHIAAIVGPFFPHELYEKVGGVYDRISKLNCDRMKIRHDAGELLWHAQRDRGLPRMRRGEASGLFEPFHAL